jgi:pyrroloquinoline quinone (PQQ) biosynthesis protein C
MYEGRAVSHFELYLEAMREAGADIGPIETLLANLTAEPESFSPQSIVAPEAARRFVASTFELIASGEVHAIAAAFTFGREDVIPDMFRSLVRDLNAEFGGQFSKFLWYLERHIEVDGEDHGPLSLRMVADLCGEDERLWEEAADAAETALVARLALWDGILAEL